MTYEDKWYKVWYKQKLYTGETYSTFVYAFGENQVSRKVKEYGAYRVTLWK